MDNSKDQTILVVDDTVENIDVLRSILGEKYKVKVALNGEKALKIAEKKPPDIILLDVMMPEMDGYEVCRRLKMDEVTKDIPVIFVTGHQDEEEKDKGLALGAVDYLSKPVEPELVIAKIEKYIII
ncbi:response regulator [Candidatus Latescibacterota bacterium]